MYLLFVVLAATHDVFESQHSNGQEMNEQNDNRDVPVVVAESDDNLKEQNVQGVIRTVMLTACLPVPSHLCEPGHLLWRLFGRYKLRPIAYLTQEGQKVHRNIVIGRMPLVI